MQSLEQRLKWLLGELPWLRYTHQPHETQLEMEAEEENKLCKLSSRHSASKGRELKIYRYNFKTLRLHTKPLSALTEQKGTDQWLKGKWWALSKLGQGSQAAFWFWGLANRQESTLIIMIKATKSLLVEEQKLKGIWGVGGMFGVLKVKESQVRWGNSQPNHKWKSFFA